MKVLNITNNKYITPKTTGYAAAVGIGLSLFSGALNNKNIRKFHKPLAYASVALTAIHIGLIEYNHYKWKHPKTTDNWIR